MNRCRVFRWLSSFLFPVLLLLLLLPCEADVTTIQITMCNQLPGYVSTTLTVVCSSQSDPKNYKVKIHIHQNACGNSSIHEVDTDRGLKCSLYGDKKIPWVNPSFNPMVGNEKLNRDHHEFWESESKDGVHGGVRKDNDDNRQQQQHHLPKHVQNHFSFKEDGIYVQNKGRDELVEHWKWRWPSDFDVYIHNNFSNRNTRITVTCETSLKTQKRRNLRPRGDPLLLKLKVAARVHRGISCGVYWSGAGNENGNVYRFYAFDVARVGDDIYYFHDGVRGILNWHLKEDGLYHWDDERKLEDKVKPWTRRSNKNRKGRNKRFKRNYNQQYKNNYGYPDPDPEQHHFQSGGHRWQPWHNHN